MINRISCIETGRMQQPTSAISRRRHNGPKPLTDCGSFATLARKTGALEALDRALRQTLPAPLRNQVRFADLRHDRLVFLASSPAWASRLRLLQTQILATAQSIGVRANEVKVKVVSPEPEAAQPQRLKALSANTASHLRAAAASFPDPELRSLFLSLAALAETRTTAPDTRP